MSKTTYGCSKIRGALLLQVAGKPGAHLPQHRKNSIMCKVGQRLNSQHKRIGGRQKTLPEAARVWKSINRIEELLNMKHMRTMQVHISSLQQGCNLFTPISRDGEHVTLFGSLTNSSLGSSEALGGDAQPVVCGYLDQTMDRSTCKQKAQGVHYTY